MPDYYRLLNVEPGAAEGDLRKAINRELRVWSNRTNAPQMERRQEAERRVKELEEAEQVLLDAGRRAAYDRQERKGGNQAPAVPPPAPSEEGDPVREGWRLLFEDRVREAIVQATRATEQQPSNADAWALLGQAKFRFGETEDAIYEYKRAIKLRAGEASFYFDLGAIYESLERWKEARLHFEQAAQLDPKTAMYRAAIGMLCVKTDLFAEAITILERCVREEPANGSYQYALAFAYHAGMLASWWQHEGRSYCISQEQAEAARAIVEKTRALKFEDADLHRQIAETGRLVESMFSRQFKGSWLMVCFLGIFYVVPGVLWWWANRRPLYRINHDLYELVNKGKIGSLVHDLAQEVGGLEGATYYSALPPGLKWSAFVLPRVAVWVLILVLSPFTFLFLVYDNYGAKYLIGALGGGAALLFLLVTAGGLGNPRPMPVYHAAGQPSTTQPAYHAPPATIQAGQTVAVPFVPSSDSPAAATDERPGRTEATQPAVNFRSGHAPEATAAAPPRPDMDSAPVPRNGYRNPVGNERTEFPGEHYAGTRLRLLTPADLTGITPEKIRYAINEMYARHGADFRDKALKAQFEHFTWYRPIPGKSYDSAESEFTDIERSNVELLGTYRNIVGKGTVATAPVSLPPAPEKRRGTREPGSVGVSLHERTRNLDNL